MSEFVVQPPVILSTGLMPGPVERKVGYKAGPIQVAVPGVRGQKGDSGIDNSVMVAHISDSEPHMAYDDMPSLKLIFENGLI